MGKSFMLFVLASAVLLGQDVPNEAVMFGIKGRIGGAFTPGRYTGYSNIPEEWRRFPNGQYISSGNTASLEKSLPSLEVGLTMLIKDRVELAGGGTLAISRKPARMEIGEYREGSYVTWYEISGSEGTAGLFADMNIRLFKSIWLGTTAFTFPIKHDLNFTRGYHKYNQNEPLDDKYKVAEYSYPLMLLAGVKLYEYFDSDRIAMVGVSLMGGKLLERVTLTPEAVALGIGVDRPWRNSNLIYISLEGTIPRFFKLRRENARRGATR